MEKTKALPGAFQELKDIYYGEQLDVTTASTAKLLTCGFHSRGRIQNRNK